MNDRSDELSTADLVGRSEGVEAADGRADRDEPADRTGERRDGFPGDRGAEAEYAGGRDAYAADRAYADDRPHAEDGAYADDRPQAAGDGAYADNRPQAGDGTYADNRPQAAADGTFADDRPQAGDGTFADKRPQAGDGTYADDGPYADDRVDGLGSREVSGATGPATAPDQAGYADVGTTAGRVGYADGGTVSSGNGAAGQEPLLGSADTEGFRARWTDVQTGFVDEPRRAVEQADGLTAELMQHLAKSFADERLRLERQWDRGEDIATDDLRTAFQRYRSFFERLLST